MGIKTDNLEKIYEQLQSVLTDTKTQKTARTILQEFAKIEKSNIRQNFLNSVDPYGVTWAPLKAGGRVIKGRKGKNKLDKSAKPLMDTGRLVGSISYRTFLKEANSKSSFSTMLLMYNKGSGGVDYGDYHQFGIGVTARPYYPTPERGLPDAWTKDLLKITDKILSKLLSS